MFPPFSSFSLQTAVIVPPSQVETLRRWWSLTNLEFRALPATTAIFGPLSFGPPVAFRASRGTETRSTKAQELLFPRSTRRWNIIRASLEPRCHDTNTALRSRCCTRASLIAFRSFNQHFSKRPSIFKRQALSLFQPSLPEPKVEATFYSTFIFF